MPRISKLAALMDHAEADVLTYMGFPAPHRTKISSTNPLERLNGEIKRCSEVVGIFPKDCSDRSAEITWTGQADAGIREPSKLEQIVFFLKKFIPDQSPKLISER
jgi:transposase-like protein